MEALVLLLPLIYRETEGALLKISGVSFSSVK